MSNGFYLSAREFPLILYMELLTLKVVAEKSLSVTEPLSNVNVTVSTPFFFE